MGQDIAKQLRSAIEELEQFLKKHPDAIKLASDILKKEQKLEAEEKPIKAPPVKQYITVHKIVTCLHCGYTYEKTRQLSSKDYTIVVDRDGTFKEITFVNASPNEIVTVKHHVAQCHRCVEMVKGMYREELEHRYLTLLNKLSVKRVPYDPFE